MSNNGKRKKAKTPSRGKELLTDVQHSDVHILNKKRNGGRAFRPPRVTVFIDHFTRMVVGFRVGNRGDYTPLVGPEGGALPGRGSASLAD